jgi:photoactive yellow protein
MNISFEQADVLACLEALDDAALDNLDFGVIGFNSDTIVCRYNSIESQMAELSQDKVLGHPLFSEIAQCMNNFLVALRFEDAIADGNPLDATIDYLLTWRMRPTKVQLRMLYSPEYAIRYVLLHRLA